MRAQKPFDTLQFANRMKSVGMEPKLAEEQAEAIADALWNGLDSKLDSLTTKEEFKTECGLIRKECDSIRKEFKAECDSIRKEFKAECDSIRKEFKAECELIRKDIITLDIKFTTLTNATNSKLTWLISLFGTATVFISIISFLHTFHII